ncbi:MAG: YfhO family protein, partial [FCB group bacterium]|nr:YfhO family protein [FCB group bacterium]
GAYISPLLVVLALVALVKNFRKNVKWLLLLVIFLTIGLGDFSAYSPWSLLSRLPGFGSARCTGRSFQLVILTSAILGGLGFDILKKTPLVVRYKLLKGLLYGGVLVIVATNMVLAYPILSTAFRYKPQQIFQSPEFIQAVGTKNQVYRHFLENRGSLLPPWLSAYHCSRGLVDENNNMKMEIILSGRAEIVHRFYTPNRIEYEINAIEPGDMVISMGYDEGWHATDGRTLFPKNNLIAFPFKKGHSQVVLYYRTPYFYTGMLISFIAIIGCFLYGKKYGGISKH